MKDQIELLLKEIEKDENVKSYLLLNHEVALGGFLHNILISSFDVDSSNMHLSEKIEFLYKKNLYSTRMKTELENVRYRGNDASHFLKGAEGDAKFVIDICNKVKEMYNSKKNSNKKMDQCDDILKEGAQYKGKVAFYKKNRYGFLKEEKTGEKVFFSYAEQDKVNIEKLKVGQEVVYTVEYTSGVTKYKAADIKVIGSVKLIDNGDEDRYGFIPCGNNEDIFFTFEHLAHSIRKQIKVGSKVSFI